jgi:quercetin dioxygenase-like cupin family protein
MLPILGLLLAAPAVAQNFDEGDSEIQVLRNGSQASVSGPVANFTGSVRVDSRFNAPPPARIGGGTVTFEPGARTAWHTHPLGQTLIITSGIGWVQSRGGPVEEVHPGDIVWIPPNAEHWHGATAENAMSHIAISEKLDGIAVNWLEKVTDAEYRAGLQ